MFDKITNKLQKLQIIKNIKSISNKWKISFVIVLVVLLVLTIAMCSKSEPTALPIDDNPNDKLEEPIDNNEELENDNDEKIVEKKEPKFRAPLTNEGRDTKVNNRPFAIFVENSQMARPQSGLDKADIVYETLAEGGITRFIAIYQSQKPESIGPIRSAREYMLDIAGDYDAVIVHAGGSPAALDRILKEQLPSISELIHGSYFTRESFRKAPHNVYSNIDKLTEGAKARNFRDTYSLPRINFAPDEVEDIDVKGTKHSEVIIPYMSDYQVKYIYDEHTNKYNRFINNMPHTDLTTNQQLRTSNLFIAMARHNVLDGEGRLAIGLHSNGKGYVLQQGKYQEASWRYEDGLMRFYVAGQEVPYFLGNTWIQIVPDVIGVKFE